MATFAAIDLGAESGRVVLGALSGTKLELAEVHRFANGPVRTGDELHWDVLRLWSEMKVGVGKAAAAGGELRGVGIDTWGVDFALLGRHDTLLGNPFHYRDARTDGILERAFQIVPREEIFRQTGIQFMQFNTLFQLLAMRLAGSPLLNAAQTLLMMPDLFNFWFTGRKCCEFTDATTTQAFDPRAVAAGLRTGRTEPEAQAKVSVEGAPDIINLRGGWAADLIARFGIPTRIFGEIIPAGTVLGPLRCDIADELNARDVPIIAPATHDTGSAVAAVPATGDRPWAFLSSGTWSLMGVELAAPVIDERSLRYNFTNEGGVGGTFRFLKNIMGLWLVQECRRTWERAGQRYEYAELGDLAAAAKPFAAIIDPDDPSFLAPGDMPGRIDAYCHRTGQSPPAGPGETIRACLESLALTYRQTLARIEECAGRHIEVIHAVGGGIQNKHLCQWTADATGRPVIAGPVEATAVGNVIVQAIATGALNTIRDARELVRRSFELTTYEPINPVRWDEPYARFQHLRMTDLT